MVTSPTCIDHLIPQTQLVVLCNFFCNTKVRETVRAMAGFKLCLGSLSYCRKPTISVQFQSGLQTFCLHTVILVPVQLALKQRYEW